MKKIFGFIWIFITVIVFASCGMKECTCVSKNLIIAADTVYSDVTDTVNDFTHGNCDDFETSETIMIDTNITLYRTVTCD